MKKLILLTFSILIVYLCFGQTNQYTYIEKDGILSIEAEKYTTNKGVWEEVEGRVAYPKEKEGLGVTQANEIEIIAGNKILSQKLTGTQTVYTEPESLNCALVNANANVIAKVKNEPDFASCFLYEAGAQMPGGVAKGMRAGIFNGRENLTPEGAEIFKTLIKYAQKQSVGKNVLFVTNHRELKGHDYKMAQLIKESGLELTIAEDEEIQTEDAEGKSIVFISESVASGPVGDKFRNVEIPVIIAEPYIFDDMGMVVSEEKWQPESGQLGNAMLIRHGEWSDYLRYAVYFSSPGNYNIWMLGQSGGDDKSDKLKVFFNTDDISENGDFLEVQFSPKLEWTNPANQPEKHNQKSGQNSIIEVLEKGWYNLYLAKGTGLENDSDDFKQRKYPNWRVDKILLTKENTRPSADGHPITLNNGSISVPEKFMEDKEFYPSQVWEIHDDYVVVEAENIDHHEYWELKNKPKGYSGKGYLEWQGPDRTKSIEGLGGNDDEIFVRQGPQDEWLILSVVVEEAGKYAVNVVNHHKMEDGDNDAWVNIIGFRPYNENAWDTQVRRMGDSFSDGKGFTWLDWGVRELPLQKGLNHIYIGGRSIGWGIDKVAVYKADDENAQNKVMNNN